MFKVLDLFSGIGGFSLGLERTGGFKTVAFCEIEEFPRKVLAKHWPDVPIFKDVRSLNGEQVGPVDLICGGFPCQPFSSAARGRNIAEDMWPEMARISSEIRPRFAIAENVKFDPVARAADHFCGLGMQCDVINISGYAIGSDTKRSRWWAIAYPYESGELQSAINAEAQKLPEIRNGVWEAENYRDAICVSDRIPSHMGEIGCYGNGIYPQIPEMIGRAILENTS